MTALRQALVLFAGSVGLAAVIFGGLYLAVWAERRRKPVTAIAAVLFVMFVLCLLLSMGMIGGTR